ncbi:MAG: phosphoribosylformylglycinamidine cyclo-ligase [Micromonosporaceae bacterium]|nr:phosphoribosylformylglycinamidine cyclo-ligase [Micromonosporaceae bacterium]
MVALRPPIQVARSTEPGAARGAGRYRQPVKSLNLDTSIQPQPEGVAALRTTTARFGRPEVVDYASGFVGLLRFGFDGLTQPLLASATDGVGPKLSIAQQMDIHDTIGIDLVAMVADDIVTCGARPLFLTYYLSCGEVVPERVNDIIAGVKDGCREAGCFVLGGETAEHAGVLRANEYDLSGTAVGVVDEENLLGAHRVEVGDAIVALGSSGLHANGYALVQHALFGLSRMRLDTVIEEFENQRTLGEELLTPAVIYARHCLDLMVEVEVRALAHVTGGGIAGNLERVLPDGVDAVVRRSSWRPQPIFDLVARKGRIDQAEMEATFNMGIGMLAIIAPHDVERALAFLKGRGLDAWVAGEIVEGTGDVQMVGAHTRG